MSHMPSSTPIEDRIALLLAKAESTTPEEAEALTEHAERLMLRHGIEQVRIDAARSGMDRTAEEIVERDVASFTGGYARAMLQIGVDVALAFGAIKCIQRRSRVDSGRRLVLLGYERDVEQARTLITSLVLQARVAVDSAARREAKDPYSDWAWLSPAGRFAWRKSFLIGFGEGAAARLAETRRRVVVEEETAAPGTAVALVNRQQAVEKHFADLGLRRGRSVRVGDGYHDGHRAGRQANVGATAVGGTRALGA
jgi:hypothetical protein